MQGYLGFRKAASARQADAETILAET